MGKVISFANQKGGVAKTTSVVHTGGALLEMGKKVLLIDVDGQGSLASSFGMTAKQIENLNHTVYDTLVKEEPLENCVIKIREDLHLAPSNEWLYVADVQTASDIGRERNLVDGLSAIKNDYDYILIDCPPNLGFLTVSALVASDTVVIPMATDKLSMLGVKLLLKTIKRVRVKINKDLKIAGILPTRHHARTKNAQEILDVVGEYFGENIRIFTSIIRETVKIRDANTAGQMMVEYDPTHPVTEDYRNFVKELVNYA